MAGTAGMAVSVPGLGQININLSQSKNQSPTPAPTSTPPTPGQMTVSFSIPPLASAGLRQIVQTTTGLGSSQLRSTIDTIGNGLKDLDNIVPGSVDFLKDTSKYLSAIANNTTTMNLVNQFDPSGKLADHIGKASSAASDLLVQCDDYQNSHNPVTKAFNQHQAGTALNDLTTNMNGMVDDLQRLGL